jgi:hypothetical protein
MGHIDSVREAFWLMPHVSKRYTLMHYDTWQFRTEGKQFVPREISPNTQIFAYPVTFY